MKRVNKANNNYETGERNNVNFGSAHKFNLAHDCSAKNLAEITKHAHLN